MSNSLTSQRSLHELVLEAVLECVAAKLRMDRSQVTSDLANGREIRIPSRHALVVIAAVQKRFELARVVKTSDLRPDQITSVGVLVDLLERRIQEARSR